MTLAETNIVFSGNPLNRAGNERGGEEWLAQKEAAGDTLFVPLWQLCPLVLPPQDGIRDVGWLPRAAFGDLLAGRERLKIFLGINKRGKALFAVDISDLSAPESDGVFAGLGEFNDLRELAMAGDMSRNELAILAQAKAMLDWHKRHNFCSACGAATKISEAGYKRICPTCEAEHFPRTDPVVIMLATHGEHCLLGRQQAWGANMFSALAGFMEPGETIEEAVARELYEEAALEINSVRYLASQPWAFPSSLMIGCIAEAANTDIKIDGIELAEAKWVSRDELKAAANGEGTLAIPPKMAIARNLINYFLLGRGGE